MLCFFDVVFIVFFFFFSSRRRHTRSLRDWSSDVCSSDLGGEGGAVVPAIGRADLERDPGAPGRAHQRIDELRRGDRRVVDGAGDGAVTEEIGRASCRERVEEGGGGGVVTKKRLEVCEELR